MDDQGEVTTELTATQYVILAENQRKKRALAEAKQKFNALAEENKTLLKQFDELQKETYEVTEALRRELLTKNEKIGTLENEVSTLKEDHEQDVIRLQTEAATREARIMGDATAKQKELQGKIDSLTTELNNVLEFKSRQHEVEHEVLRLKEENQELKEKLEQQRQDLERYYIELNTKMRKEYEQKLEELKKSAEEEIDERLDASVKRILQQNRRMAEELKIHVQETDVLQSEVRVLEDDRSRLLREVTLKSELEEGYAKRGAKQQQAIKEAQSKIASLEESLQQVIQEFEKERVAIRAQRDTTVAEANQEAEALRRLVALKTRELKNVRRLAQEVLMQRSDVETFLLSSLHQVRREIERHQLEKIGPGGSAGGSRPGSGPPGQAGRVDIRELPWEDREKILRLLFAKINNQVQQAYYSNLPAHPLENNGGPGLQGMKTDAGPADLV